MEFYTSYYGAMREITDDYLCVGISRIVPFIDRDNFRTDSVFAPEEVLLNSFKSGIATEDDYKRRYVEHLFSIFTKESFKEHIDLIEKEFGDKYKGCVFMCYESPEKFCHRHILARIIELVCGRDCKELDLKHNHTGAVFTDTQKSTPLF